ncbi:valine--tRNA ligase [Sphingobium lactosutens]|uniref:Valine--tRNA ligase n=1 Tax=Sphingobium lactosutens DS20 TaxID=1331060 RepID=T0HX17_9SPHN|nr:valine--tRNA ligase [Sphingobium lactosutens]EQB16683.1 valyl-tRNA synthetase [Sphingobium lactosutens DS20]
MTELPKTFDPASIEARWYQHWEEKGLFRPDRPDATPFTIVNPPPNVTGSLHIGHALDNTLQDIVIRYERLRGKDALWVVGTDHAGIATQMVVERQLNAKGEKRTDYSREDFIAKVWEWKAESGGAITRQLRRLGCSMDWANERFTMDEGFSKAVVKVFVELHKRGLLYRDKRLVNWDPHFRSAISDLEVETVETKGGFWRFRYPLADGVTLADGSDHIVVATTRPETMLADMAVAVHPDDARYKDVIGKAIILPITGRRIPIVADDHADPELGTGAVKITPGHDFNDFEVGKRAGFKAGDMLNMLDADANVVQAADGKIPDAFLGLHRFKRDGVDGAREAVVAEMKALGFLVPHVTKNKEGEEVTADFEPRTIQTPFGDRSGVVIEPWLTDQWYVDAAKLAQAPMQAVRDGAIEIVPRTWEKTFFNWMENIQPWCVSRQLWWGHRIPAWFDADGNSYVAETEAEAQTLAGNKALTRDPDVLDTWFSSALWPFGTLGWPEQSETLARRYPNDLLISGFDILFFWDARMAMMGQEFMGDVPWRKLYLHGLVRAADGQKMSKSKGNVVDPLGLIDRFGADALRFFMAAMESQGRDVKMDEKRVEGYRNFATKLWNAARFLQSNGVTASTTHEAPAATLPVNRWIIAETVGCVQAIDTAMAELRFDAAANAIYHFVWDQFCDWYIELTKGAMDDETRAVAGWAFDQILVMLHPFMPFITEELWNLTGARDTELIVARWPVALYEVDQEAQAEIDWLIRLVSRIRSDRAEMNIPPAARTDLIVHNDPKIAGFKFEGGPRTDLVSRFSSNAAALARMARIDVVEFALTGTAIDLRSGSSVDRTKYESGKYAAFQVVVDDTTYSVPLEGVIDIGAERARLAKALAGAEKERDSLGGRLSNASFVEKAKPEAVAKAREDHAEKTAEAERLRAALERLG